MRTVVTALSLVLLACGDGGPNSPGNVNQIPNVAGTYYGSLTWTIDGTQVATPSMRIVVVQAGPQLTITGTMTVEGQTIALPAVTGNINATGFFTATGGGSAATLSDANCGTIRTTSSSLTFSGNTVQYVENASTAFCGNWSLSGTLRR